MTTRFTPGDWVAICGEGTWILAKLAIDDERLDRLWDTLSPDSSGPSGGSLDAALEVLLADGFAAMPPFAAVARGEGGDDGATRIVVRHPAVVDVLIDGTPVRHGATPGGTWTDVTVPASESLVLRAGADAASAVRLPLRHGMTPAAAITVTLAASAAPTATTADVAPVVVAEAPEPAEPVEAPEPEPADPAAEVAPVIADEDPDLAHTALRTTLSTPSPQTSSVTAVWKVGEAPPAPAAPAASTASAPAASGGLIDGVPWLTGNTWTPAPQQSPPPSTAPPPSPAPAKVAPPAPASSATIPGPSESGAEGDADDNEDKTVIRSELLKNLGSAGIVGPTVLAAYCPEFHPTSSHEPRCRLCGEPVLEQEPVQIARPALGALVLANGDRLVLDKDAALGRAPSAPEGSTDRPHLLKVGDSGEISRQHALITLDGWHVMVRDLGTANGTTLTLPGGKAQQLRANEDYPLEDGAIIGIADVVNLTFEVRP